MGTGRVLCDDVLHAHLCTFSFIHGLSSRHYSAETKNHKKVGNDLHPSQLTSIDHMEICSLFHWTCLVTGACLVCEAGLR